MSGRRPPSFAGDIRVLAAEHLTPRGEGFTVNQRIGSPKSGLRMTLDEAGSQLALLGRPDPLMLYLVFGTALVVAVAGSIIVSPQYGLAGVMLLSILFLPLIVFTAYGALRLKTVCVFDRAAQRVIVDERSYAGHLRREWPLAALQSVVLVTRPRSGWASGGATYELFLDFGSEQYLAEVAGGERGLKKTAQRICLFVGVPTRSTRIPAATSRANPRHVVLVSLLFALPLLGSTAGLAFVFREQPPSTSLMVVSMSALVVCQFGAILAYSYDRSQHGRPRS